MADLTAGTDRHLLDTLDRMLDKGIVIDAWISNSAGAIEMDGIRWVVVPPDNDDGGGSAPAPQMRRPI